MGFLDDVKKAAHNFSITTLEIGKFADRMQVV
jgi:hypothetical protein